jgi:endonuclease I
VKYNVRYVGLDSLDLMGQDEVKKIAEGEAGKISRLINEEISLSLHLKTYDKDGSAKKFSIHVRADGPGIRYSAEDMDWKLHNAIRKVFENLKNEVTNDKRSKRVNLNRENS